MNKKFKKLIAKEFIVIIITGSVVFFCFQIFHLLEKYRTNEIIFIKEEMKVVERAGLRVLIKDFYAKYDVTKYSEEQVDVIINKFGDNYIEIIKYFYSTYEPERYSENKLLEIIKYYSLNNKEYLRINNLKKIIIIDELQGRIDDIQNRDINKSKIVLISVIIGLVYPLRFVMSGLIWSIKTLKE